MAKDIRDTTDSTESADDFTDFINDLGSDPVQDQIRGHRAPEILPEIDVAEIALSLIHISEPTRPY